QHAFPIAKTIRGSDVPPKHRLYAKLVLLPDGSKQYVRSTDDDRALYDAAEDALRARDNPYPIVAIAPGYNTNQALGYNYRYWHEMFNARQLLCLSILAERIRTISDPAVRDLFVCLLSGTLEFNNMFASYKGEGTGAVRHMFAHHILKPERVPIEGNVWGTSKSSGSFSTLFKSRLLRAIEYHSAPFELEIERTNGRSNGKRIFGGSPPFTGHVETKWPPSPKPASRAIYLSCGSSASTGLADGSVDF